MSLWRRVMILVLAGALLEISVSALAGLMLTGSARYLVVGSAVGLVLAAAWIRPWRGLPLVTGFLGLVLGLILVRLPQGGSGAGTLHGLVSERLQSTALPAASGVVLTICVVIIATGCGWLLFERRTPWPVVALAASAYFVRADVSKSYEDHIPLFLIGALILILCTYLPVSRWMWSAVPVLALACGLMAVAWRLPAAQVTLSQHLFDPVSLLSRPGLPGNGSRVLTLTTPFYPTNTPIMQVRINRAGLRPYWQSQIFDQYDGHSWVASNSVQRAVPAGGSLTPGAASPRQTVIAMVSVFQPTEDLVFPGTPLRASVPTDAIYAEGTGQMLETRAQDLLTPASTYAVSGSLSPAASSAPINLNADLQLPPEPLKLHRLARHIVSGQRGPVAQLLAIRGYLRDSGQFHYDIHAVPPPDQDAVVSFLFSSRSGFCNQFASSLVVLAREVGIPARLVSGFVSGTYANGSFLVRDRDAHSWAQAYVPGTGWVMLDPTPGFQPDPAQSPVSGRNNPLHAAARPAVAPVPRPTTGSGWGRASSFHQVPTPRIHHARPSGPPSGMILGFMVFALIVAGLFVYAAWPRSLRQLYLSAVRGSPRRYGKLKAADTPREYAERFRSNARLFPDIDLITALYMRQRYAQAEPSEQEIRRARRAWLRIRWRWIGDVLRV